MQLGTFTHPSVEGFWAFVEERENIRLKKEGALPIPREEWTDDPTLQHFHFCNVRRQDDYGTRWYIARIGSKKPPTQKPPALANLLWQTCFFRLVNSTEWFERLDPKGFPPVTWTSKGTQGYDPDWEERVKAAGVPSNLAYRSLTSGKRSQMSWTRNRRLRHYLRRCSTARFMEPFSYHVFGAETPAAAWKAVQEFDGIGAFAGLQVYRDLLLVGVFPFSENDWTYIGPGADEGVKVLIFAEERVAFRVPPPNYQERYDWLKKLWASPANKLQLVLGDVEHCMCEYVKWMKFRQGAGKKRRYIPHGSARTSDD